MRWRRRKKALDRLDSVAMASMSDVEIYHFTCLAAQHYIEGNQELVVWCRDQADELQKRSALVDARDMYIFDVLLANLHFRNDEWEEALALYRGVINTLAERKRRITQAGPKQHERAELDALNGGHKRIRAARSKRHERVELDFLSGLVGLLKTNVAQTLSRMGDPDTALAVIEEAGRDIPQWGLLYDVAGGLRSDRGDWDGARKAYATWFRTGGAGDRCEYHLRLGNLAISQWLAATNAQGDGDTPALERALAEAESEYAKAVYAADPGEGKSSAESGRATAFLGLGLSRWRRAELCARTSRHDEAISFLEQGRESFAQAGDHSWASFAAERQGDFHLELGRVDDAENAYAQALLSTRELSDEQAAEPQGRIYALLALAAMERRNTERALDCLKASVAARRSADNPDPYGTAVVSMAPLLAGRERRQRVCQTLVHLMLVLEDGDERMAAAGALAELGRRRDEDVLGEGDEYTGMYPFVTVVAIEADEALVVDEDRSRLLTKLVPELRARMEHQYGLQLPGVRVRASDMEELSGKYIVSINDVPTLLGEVQPGRRFLVGHAEHPRTSAASTAGTDPLTGMPLVWVEPGQDTGGAPTYDHEDHMARMLEGVFEQRLHEFVDHQGVAARLEVAGSGGREGPMRSMLRSASRLSELVAVMRALAAERVPLTELEAIVAHVHSACATGASLPEIVAEARLLPSVRTHLWGNDGSFTVLRLTPPGEAAIASWVQRPANLAVLAIEPEACQQVLDAVRGSFERVERPVLVVRDGELRLLIRQLLHLEWPLLPVLSDSELLPGLGLNGELIEVPSDAGRQVAA